MKYFLKSNGWLQEITKRDFYNMKRRKGAQITTSIQNNEIIGRIVRFK